MKRFLGFVVLGAALVGSSAWAAQETNRELAKTFVNFYIQQHEYNSARKYLTNHLQSDPEDAWAWNMLGLTHVETKAYAKAVDAFGNAVKHCKDGDEKRPFYRYN